MVPVKVLIVSSLNKIDKKNWNSNYSIVIRQYGAIDNIVNLVITLYGYQ